MSFTNSKELLDFLLVGREPTAGQVDQIAQDLEEDLHLDFKSGKAMDKDRRKFRSDLRQDAAAFANAEGGVLIVGVDENEKKVDGCKSGDTNPDDLAERTLREFAGYISPSPRFRLVEHEEGSVLLIAVPRAQVLVPTVVVDGSSGHRTLTYYLRLGKSSIPLPEYLVSDLILGKRRSPLVTMELVGEGDSNKIHFDLSGPPSEIPELQSTDLQFRLHNISFLRCRDLRVGVVGWGFQSGRDVREHMLGFVELDTRSSAGLPPPVHFWKELGDLGAFESTDFSIPPFEVPPRSRFQGGVRCSFAVYLLEDSRLPTWYELVGERVSDGLAKSDQELEANGQLELRPVEYGRNPLVAITDLAPSDR